MRGLYLLVLLFSIGGLAMADRRYKLAYFLNKQRTILIVLITMAIFIVWDIAGILRGIFFIGDTQLLIGVRLGEFPIEELFFLLLLSYTSLLLYLAIKHGGQR